jgi:hypothetical protein
LNQARESIFLHALSGAVVSLEVFCCGSPEQEVNMLRHVPVNVKPEAAPHALQGWLEDSAAFIGDKQATAVVAAESDEMTLPAVLKAR